MSTKPSCEHHHHYWALIGLLALALVCCFIIIWLFPNNIDTKSPITKILKPKAVPAQDLWQKFSNEKYDYIITIPASWPITINSDTKVTFGKVPFETGSGWLSLSIDSNAIISSWVQENYAEENASSTEALKISDDFKSTTGIEAKVYTRAISSSTLENFVIFNHEEKLYVFNYLTGDQKFNDTILQTLNSLAFTD